MKEFPRLSSGNINKRYHFEQVNDNAFSISNNNNNNNCYPHHYYPHHHYYYYYYYSSSSSSSYYYYYYYYYLRELLTQRKQKLRWWGGLTTLVLMWGIGCTLNFYPRLLKSKNVCWVAWEIRVTQLTFWLYISSCFHLEITRNHLKIDKIQEGALPYGDLIYTVPPKWTYIFLHLKTLLKQSNSHHTIYPSVYVSLLNNWPHDLMTASRGSRTSAISIPNTVFSQYCIPYQDFDESSSPE